jgi:predicted transcriptional regulator
MKTEQTKLKINELMEHFNIKSVSEFAKLTGITQSNFSRYLSGDRKLSS